VFCLAIYSLAYHSLLSIGGDLCGLLGRQSNAGTSLVRVAPSSPEAPDDFLVDFKMFIVDKKQKQSAMARERLAELQDCSGREL
jgi:hypothetical protein